MEFIRKGVKPLKTVEEIIAYLEMELADAYFMHDEMKKADTQRALAYLIRATTILNLLETIKGK
jgi:hypothetical protein